jgi:hypothetical protein
LLDQIDCPLAAVIADGAYDGEPAGATHEAIEVLK